MNHHSFSDHGLDISCTELESRRTSWVLSVDLKLKNCIGATFTVFTYTTGPKWRKNCWMRCSRPHKMLNVPLMNRVSVTTTRPHFMSEYPFHLDLDTLEECIEIKIIKHKGKKVARYLYSKNIQMVRHINMAFGKACLCIHRPALLHLIRFNLPQAQGQSWSFLSLQESLSRVAIKHLNTGILLCWMDNGHCLAQASPSK